MTAGPDGLVSVVVLTFRRNDDLLALLPRLDEQIAAVAPTTVEVVVVDNDPDGGAASAVEASGSPSTRYVHEPLPGITHARNRALDEAASSRLLVFIDDDELPGDTWLASMLQTHRRTGAAGVAGLVVPRYEATPEPWIEAGGFFVRQDHAEGRVMPAAGSGNLLLDLDQVRSLGLRFDERFGLTGGSDHLFTRDLVRRGGRIVWSTGAWVTDVVPATRSTRAWVLQRQFRVGNTWSRAALVLADPGVDRSAERIRLSARGTARVLVGGARLLVGRALGSQRHHARGSKTFHRGRGMVSGAWGGTFEEYRRP
ncbi:MAG: glycosyltransferase [Nocardioidaceae bacterium]|nr:glycosyltransferase [Nocardioidaceae bacterium]